MTFAILPLKAQGRAEDVYYKPIWPQTDLHTETDLDSWTSFRFEALDMSMLKS
jgi:hypothetical protein